MEGGGVRMFVNTTRRDAITAAGACMARTVRCVESIRTPGGRTPDACWGSVPRCATNHPWTEDGTCCPVRCAELYAALRGMGYPVEVANLRTIQSVCFNGLAQALGRP